MSKKLDISLMIESLRAEGCLCCGDLDVTVVGLDETEIHNLEFHHVDPTTKRFNILSTGNRSYADFLFEIAKTVILCTSCHRLAHAGKVTIERDDDDQTWICHRRSRKPAGCENGQG